MVKVEIVDEQDAQANSPYASQASSRTGSSVSLSSVGSELNGEESFYERLSALVDIVPPATRHSISSKFSKTTSFIKTSGRLVGNLVWIVTTSALLVGLPLAMSLEDEAKVVAQEQEMLAQQQGAQQVRIRSYSSLFCFPIPYLPTAPSVLPSFPFECCPLSNVAAYLPLQFALFLLLLTLPLTQMMQPSMYPPPPGSEQNKGLVPPGF